jgi:hypothetical protein
LTAPQSRDTFATQIKGSWDRLIMSSPKDSSGKERKARLAEALRANLRRRKAQSRGRAESIRSPEGAGGDRDVAPRRPDRAGGDRDPAPRRPDRAGGDRDAPPRRPGRAGKRRGRS